KVLPDDGRRHHRGERAGQGLGVHRAPAGRHSRGGSDCPGPGATRRAASRGRLSLITKRYGILTADRPHSALMLRARMNLPHFPVSSAMSFRKSAGEPASTTPPRSTSLAFSLGSARPALISILSFSTISAGVFLGTPTPK